MSNNDDQIINSTLNLNEQSHDMLSNSTPKKNKSDNKQNQESPIKSNKNKVISQNIDIIITDSKTSKYSGDSPKINKDLKTIIEA